MKSLQTLKLNEVHVEDLGSATAAATATRAISADFKFQAFKTKKVEFWSIHAAGVESEE